MAASAERDFAARGGLVSGNAGATDLSPYGIGALAGLAGMFSKQATDELREVFENLFKTTDPPTRKDSGKQPATETPANLSLEFPGIPWNN